MTMPAFVTAEHDCEPQRPRGNRIVRDISAGALIDLAVRLCL